MSSMATVRNYLANEQWKEACDLAVLMRHDEKLVSTVINSLSLRETQRDKPISEDWNTIEEPLDPWFASVFRYTGKMEPCFDPTILFDYEPDVILSPHLITTQEEQERQFKEVLYDKSRYPSDVDECDYFSGYMITKGRLTARSASSFIKDTLGVKFIWHNNYCRTVLARNDVYILQRFALYVPH